MIWRLGDLLGVLHAGLDPRLDGGFVGDDGRRHHRAKQIALAALVEPGVRLEPVGVQHLVVAELGRAGDLGLDDVLHEILGVLAGDDHLAAGVGAHVDLEMIGLVGEVRVADLKRRPAAGLEQRAEFFYLRVVELGGVGGKFLRFFLFGGASWAWQRNGRKKRKKHTAQRRKFSFSGRFRRDALLAKANAPDGQIRLLAKPRFQRALLGWYRAHARPLPWRSEASPYRTVVSEFMLQQTQVKTMSPYFVRWMAALPDFAALAAATEARVLRLWEGLGYYSRARNLHRLARELVDAAGAAAHAGGMAGAAGRRALHRGGGREHRVRRARRLRGWQRRPHPRPAHGRWHGVSRQRQRGQGASPRSRTPCCRPNRPATTTRR